jgi:phosphoenolpyruvate synthase/pyruvate phosphate dikinase
MSEYVLGLADANNRWRVGGKAFALGSMIRADFTVPDGFVITAEAFLHMTPALQKYILSYFDALGTAFVAVRSSAINEDGKDAAWAGQLDTFLNCNRTHVIARIEQCWESANSERAKSYARQKSIETAAVAVVVQRMVDSDVSGVAFSVHPVTGNTAQVVIEAGLGLGEAIVSGSITPDTYIVDKNTGNCLEKYISKQSRKLVRSATGITDWQNTGAHGNRQKLTDKQVVELCGQISKLEAYFGHPVDVEWAIQAGELYILQSRPITTL